MWITNGCHLCRLFLISRNVGYRGNSSSLRQLSVQPTRAKIFPHDTRNKQQQRRQSILTSSVVRSVYDLRPVRLARAVVEETVAVPGRCVPGGHSKEDASPRGAVDFNLTERHASIRRISTSARTERASVCTTFSPTRLVSTTTKMPPFHFKPSNHQTVRGLFRPVHRTRETTSKATTPWPGETWQQGTSQIGNHTTATPLCPPPPRKTTVFYPPPSSGAHRGTRGCPAPCPCVPSWYRRRYQGPTRG